MGSATVDEMRKRWLTILLFLLPLLTSPSLASVIVSEHFPFNDYPADTDYVSVYMEDEKGNCKDAGVEAIFVTFGELTLKRLEGIAWMGLDQGLGISKILNYRNGDLKEYDTWEDAIGTSEKEKTTSKGRDCICESLHRALQLTQSQESKKKNLVTVITHNEGTPCPYFDPRACRLPAPKQRIFASGPDGFLFKLQSLYRNDSSIVFLGQPDDPGKDPVGTYEIPGFVPEVQASLGCTLPTPSCYITVPKDAKCMQENNTDICTRCSTKPYKAVERAPEEGVPTNTDTKRAHLIAFCDKLHKEKGDYCLRCLCPAKEEEPVSVRPKSEKKEEKKGHGSLPAWVVVVIVLAVLCIVAGSVVGFIYLQRRYGIKRVDEYWHQKAGKEKKNGKNDEENEVSVVPTESHISETSIPINSPNMTQTSNRTDAPVARPAKMKKIEDGSTWETLSRDTNQSDVPNNLAIIAPNSSHPGDTKTKTDTADSMAAVTATANNLKPESQAGLYQNYDEVTSGKSKTKNGKKPEEKPKVSEPKEKRKETKTKSGMDTETEGGVTMTGTTHDDSESSEKTGTFGTS